VRFAALLALLLAAAPAAAQTVPGCAQDPSRWAGQPGRCLAMTSHGAARGDLLVVVLHGDVSGGGPARYHRALADRIAQTLRGAAVFALVRPGYPDGDGRTSDGDLNNRFDHYTAANMAIVAEAVAALKARTGARRVVAVGHSGGAATAANILALHPGTLDGAALLACPCALTAWRVGRRPFAQSTDPYNVAGRVPAAARVGTATKRDCTPRPPWRRTMSRCWPGAGCSRASLLCPALPTTMSSRRCGTTDSPRRWRNSRPGSHPALNNS
jgi:pimeloyl-ACP methyl ester carboxylesterase